eukprot:SAG11_NODE_34900_length_269_cov_1.023529_1_plen_85_part_10
MSCQMHMYTNAVDMAVHIKDPTLLCWFTCLWRLYLCAHRLDQGEQLRHESEIGAVLPHRTAIFDSDIAIRTNKHDKQQTVVKSY